jgi:hypothetical protein
VAEYLVGVYEAYQTRRSIERYSLERKDFTVTKTKDN